MIVLLLLYLILLLLFQDYILVWIPFQCRTAKKYALVFCVIYCGICIILFYSLTVADTLGRQWEQDTSRIDSPSEPIITAENVCTVIGSEYNVSSQYLSNIQHSMWLSLGSYCPPHRFNKYMVKLIGAKLFIAFTGTQMDDIDDIFIDLKFFKRHKFGDYIHSGFYDRSIQYFPPSDNFRDWFENITDFSEITEIIFTGHSLGGAVSQIMGSFFYEYCAYNKECTNNIQTSEIVTFGSPLVSSQYYTHYKWE